MNILYVSSVCSQPKFDQLVLDGKIASQFQNQKFHNLLLTGLRQISSDDITVVSYYPIQRKFSKNLSYEEEVVDGIKYVYPQQQDKPVINHLSKYINTYRAIKKLVTMDTIIVCNVMNFDECIAAQHIGRRFGNKVIAIVADVPGKTSGASKKNGALWKRLFRAIFTPFYRSFIVKYDAYIFLTEAMNNIVNPNNKPYIILEGFSDSRMAEEINDFQYKHDPKVLMYAGGLYREYGIQMLVEAFEQTNHEGWELHFYGDGNYVPDLAKKVHKNSGIRFLGTRANTEIVKEQIRATLLVNPRPTHEEFVKYSFPSKTLECMASGTPLLTTNLPGMPADYKNHVYLFEDESVSGYAATLDRMFKMDNSVLHQLGLSAKNYVLKEKNNVSQANKIYTYLKKLSHE